MLTEEDLTELAKSSLETALALAGSLENYQYSYLESDLHKILDYEKENYNSIFNVLPRNPEDIRYVEEYSEEEWAHESIEIEHRKIAKDVIDKMISATNTITDLIFERELEKNSFPFHNEILKDDSAILLSGGNESFILGQMHECVDWKIRFPKHLVQLNLIHESSNNILLKVICFKKNLHFYSENAELLTTSGTLEITLKNIQLEDLEVENSSEPIIITKSNRNDHIRLLNTFMGSSAGPYDILNLGSFKTSSCNASLHIETKHVSEKMELNPEMFFLNFQSIPGIRKQHYDFKFQASDAGLGKYFITNQQLENTYSNFIFGFGKLLSYVGMEEEDMSETMFIPPAGNESYEIVVLTKGCFAFNNKSELFDSEGIVSTVANERKGIVCQTNHLSYFSVGLFAPKVIDEFDFEFTIDLFPKNLQPAIIILCVSIFCVIVLFQNKSSSISSDIIINPLMNLKDNRPSCEHVYIISVYTSFNKLSSTTSKVCISLTGSNASESFRVLQNSDVTGNENPLCWASCARFLMTTKEFLGSLKYLRLWMVGDNEGNVVSWHCSKVCVYDLQTEKTYQFPVHTWLGPNSQLECIVECSTSSENTDQAPDLHSLFGHIAYTAIFFGNQNLFIGRRTYIYSLWVTSSLLITALMFIAKTHKSTLFYDILLVFVFTVLFTFLNMFIPYLDRKCLTLHDYDQVRYYEELYENYKRPKELMEPIYQQLITFVNASIILISFILNTYKSFKLLQQEADVFTRLYISILLLWIFIFEPLKGLLCSWFFSRYESYGMITRVEKSLFFEKISLNYSAKIKSKDNLDNATSLLQYMELFVSNSNKMSEAVFFETLKDMFFLILSLLIFLNMIFSARDQYGYHYQKNIKNLFKLEGTKNSFSDIRSLSNFWSWANKSLAPNLHANWPDGNAAVGLRGFANDKVSRTMGYGIMRQVRAVNNSDPTHTSMLSSKSGFFENLWKMSSDEEYQYKSANDIGSETVTGYFGSYEGGGYVSYLQGTSSALQANFEKLRKNNWIDKNTRSVFLEFSFYNAQINYFSVVQLTLEMPREGFIMPKVSVESLRLLKEEDTKLESAIEIAYLGYCVVKFTVELFGFVDNKQKYFKRRFLKSPVLLVHWMIVGGFDFWKAADFLVGLVAVSSGSFYIMKNFYIRDIVDKALESNGNVFINLTKQRDLELMFRGSLAIMGVFVTIKFMKIMKFNHRVSVLTDTLNSATPFLLQFGTFFLCFLNTFILVLSHEYGMHLQSYVTYFVTLQTLVSCLLGKSSGGDVYNVSSLGASYFLLFMLIGTVVVLNIFVMIVIQEFEKVRTIADRQSNNYEMVEHMLFKMKRTIHHAERSDLESLHLPHIYTDSPVINNFNRVMVHAHNILQRFGDGEKHSRLALNNVLRRTEKLTGHPIHK